LFGRIGGEEFSLLLQNTSTDGAKTLAERIRKNTEMIQVSFNKEIIKITASIGLAELRNEDKIYDLMNESDIALYKAKESGRNRVITQASSMLEK